jgi:hypothetical protein
VEDIESTRWCEHGKRFDDHCEDCYLADEIDSQKQKAKKFIDANVWDGEDRIGAKNDRATFTPDDLQELIFQLIDDLNT